MMRLATCLVLLSLHGAALADSRLPPARLADTQLPDPKQEAKAQELMLTIRCVVCQGQSIADSNAEMAGDMRALIRRQIAGGRTPTQVRDWLVGRYGDYVTYDPPLSAATAPLWIAPIILILIGALVARSSFRRKGRG